MEKVKILVFGNSLAAPSACGWTPVPGGAGCAPPKTMREEAEDFKQDLSEKYGGAIQYTFVDVDTEEMKEYPEAQAFLERIRLPFIWINGQPSFHGGFSLELMSKALDKLIQWVSWNPSSGISGEWAFYMYPFCFSSRLTLWDRILSAS